MSSRIRRLVAMLERNLKKDYLYDDDQIKLMKKQLRILKEELIDLKKSTRGFG